MRKINFTMIGEKDKLKLSLTNPIVYISKNYINSTSLSGGNEMLDLDSNLPNYLKYKLRHLNLKYSFGRTNDNKLGNCHIYLASAKYIDGNERICYIKVLKKDVLEISEYYGNRGAKYSAYYLLLETLLKDKYGIYPNENGNFIIDINTVDMFISAIQDIIEMKMKDMLVLQPIDNVYSITFDNNTYYYHKCYWIVKQDFDVVLTEIKDKLVYLIDNMTTLNEYNMINKFLTQMQIKLTNKLNIGDLEF